MADLKESVTLPDGPPIYDERQITPRQFEDMVIGYLGNMGTSAELVFVSTGESVPVTIDDVNKTYPIGEVPYSDKPVAPEDKAKWIDFGMRLAYVTFYVTKETAGDKRYYYDHLPARELGLAPDMHRANIQEQWPRDLSWYLRWPEREIDEASKEAA